MSYSPALNEIAVDSITAGFPPVTVGFARVTFQSLVPGQTLNLYVQLLDTDGNLLPGVGVQIPLGISSNPTIAALIPVLLSAAATAAGLTPAS